jgi:acetyl esterase/lipase
MLRPNQLCGLVVLIFGFGVASLSPAAETPSYKRTEDVVYGRKYGVALTMDVFTPPQPNGVGIVFVVSGGWFSAHEAIRLEFVEPLLERGYTVFAVVHGSQPKFQIPEILEDMHRAVRYIRHHAKDYGIDPDRIGIMGGSAGGHLSLMQGAAGKPGKADAPDPVDRESSRVQAVACFFPPTDFLNYGQPGENAIGRGVLKGFRPPFDFEEVDPETKRFVEITDEAKIEEIGKQISPVTHVSPDDPPTLIIHGDADTLVPIQQAQLMVDALTAAGVEAKLVVRPGATHGWATIFDDLALFADWFDEHLAEPIAQPAAPQAAPAEAAAR